MRVGTLVQERTEKGFIIIGALVKKMCDFSCHAGGIVNECPSEVKFVSSIGKSSHESESN